MYLVSIILIKCNLVVVDYTCILSYLGVWDQEDYGLRPAQAVSELLSQPVSGWKWYEPIIQGYVGGWDWEDHGSRPSWTKKFVRSYLNGKKLDMVAHFCHPSNSGKCNTGLQSSPIRAKRQDPVSKITRGKGMVKEVEWLHS
jgi:hypothetical protein